MARDEDAFRVENDFERQRIFLKLMADKLKEEEELKARAPKTPKPKQYVSPRYAKNKESSPDQMISFRAQREAEANKKPLSPRQMIQHTEEIVNSGQVFGFIFDRKSQKKIIENLRRMTTMGIGSSKSGREKLVDEEEDEGSSVSASSDDNDTDEEEQLEKIKAMRLQQRQWLKQQQPKERREKVFKDRPAFLDPPPSSTMSPRSPRSYNSNHHHHDDEEDVYGSSSSSSRRRRREEEEAPPLFNRASYLVALGRENRAKMKEERENKAIETLQRLKEDNAMLAYKLHRQNQNDAHTERDRIRIALTARRVAKIINIALVVSIEKETKRRQDADKDRAARLKSALFLQGLWKRFKVRKFVFRVNLCLKEHRERVKLEKEYDLRQYRMRVAYRRQEEEAERKDWLEKKLITSMMGQMKDTLLVPEPDATQTKLFNYLMSANRDSWKIKKIKRRRKKGKKKRKKKGKKKGKKRGKRPGSPKKAKKKGKKAKKAKEKKPFDPTKTQFGFSKVTQLDFGDEAKRRMYNSDEDDSDDEDTSSDDSSGSEYEYYYEGEENDEDHDAQIDSTRGAWKWGVALSPRPDKSRIGLSNNEYEKYLQQKLDYKQQKRQENVAVKRLAPWSTNFIKQMNTVTLALTPLLPDRDDENHYSPSQLATKSFSTSLSPRAHQHHHHQQQDSVVPFASSATWDSSSKKFPAVLAASSSPASSSPAMSTLQRRGSSPPAATASMRSPTSKQIIEKLLDDKRMERESEDLEQQQQFLLKRREEWTRNFASSWEEKAKVIRDPQPPPPSSSSSSSSSPSFHARQKPLQASRLLVQKTASGAQQFVVDKAPLGYLSGLFDEDEELARAIGAPAPLPVSKIEQILQRVLKEERKPPCNFDTQRFVGLGMGVGVSVSNKDSRQIKPLSEMINASPLISASLAPSKVGALA